MDSIINDFMENYTGKKHEVLKLIKDCNKHYCSIMCSEVIKSSSTQTPLKRNKENIMEPKQIWVPKGQVKILTKTPPSE